MGTPFLHEIKRQTSFFIKEKIKNARLALTDVTPIQLLTDDATNGDSPVPDARTMRLISHAAFEVDDFWRITDVLHKRLHRSDKKNWRASFNSLSILEYLLTHGPLSTAKEFQTDQEAIRDMANFQYVDDKGFNWGLSLRKKSERVVKLLEDNSYLQEERNRARKITCEIKGFGSFNQIRATSAHSLIDGTPSEKMGRSNSLLIYIGHGNENETFVPKTKSFNSHDDEMRQEVEDENEYDHPFFQQENHSRTSLLSSLT
ncbi:membrane trafficking regulatory protein [Lithospermum erythrorhizon]|uniref:Membrane trafficking regulatory protein n=1 Tax=Lithospermum erythrorhizon TaxID=34254 RepID=A0AAV3Q7U8_LITER